MKRYEVLGGRSFRLANCKALCHALETNFEREGVRKKHQTRKDGEVPRLWHVDHCGIARHIPADAEVVLV